LKSYNLRVEEGNLQAVIAGLKDSELTRVVSVEAAAFADVLVEALVVLGVVPPKDKPGEDVRVPFRSIDELRTSSEASESVASVIGNEEEEEEEEEEEKLHQPTEEEEPTPQDQAQPPESPSNDSQASVPPESNIFESKSLRRYLAEYVGICRVNFAEVDDQSTAHLLGFKLAMQWRTNMQRRLAKAVPQLTSEELVKLIIANEEKIGKEWETNCQSLRQKWIEAQMALVDAEKAVEISNEGGGAAGDEMGK
jgi:hypothetical protein